MAHLPAYQPMIAQAGPVPPGDCWAVEMKWDGIRALLYVEDGRVRIQSRNGANVTAAYPELQMLAGAVGGHSVVLDGEIVAFDDAGHVSFQALQPRMHVSRPARVAELVRAVPVTVMLFDLLHINAASAVRMPYLERRALLEQTVLPGARWQVPVYFPGGADRALVLSRQLGLEGIVCKRSDSPYRLGRRSADWVKVNSVGVGGPEADMLGRSRSSAPPNGVPSWCATAVRGHWKRILAGRRHHVRPGASLGCSRERLIWRNGECQKIASQEADDRIPRVLLFRIR
ncbi:RNA ligase family protein [Nonomuraea recticatena]